MLAVEGHLSKMHIELKNNQACYSLVLDDNQYELSKYINKDSANIIIEFLNNVNCIYCHKQIKKSFNQGYCFPCFRKLARCDSCIMSPENCHYHLGTCREPEWGLTHCMQEHIVYLANSSGVKVGITRANQIPTRWLDQGAVQALIIARVASRHQAGLLEMLCKQHYKDRTNWRAMLQPNIRSEDLTQIRDILYEQIISELSDLQVQFNNNQINWQFDEKMTDICYPVIDWPKKIISFDLDKTNKFIGKLYGFKGQYLILDTGVINLRKYTGYKIKVTIN
jgi:hypothetical protein